MSPSGPPTRLVTTESGSDTLKKKEHLVEMWHRKTSQATLDSRCQKTTALGILETPDTIRRKTAVASKRGDRWFTKPLSPWTWFQKPWLKCQYGPQKSQLGAFHVCYNVCTSVSRFGTLCRESPCLSVRKCVKRLTHTQHKQQCVAAHGGCRLGLLQNVWERALFGQLPPCLIRKQRPPGPQITPAHAQPGGRRFRKARLWRTCTVSEAATLWLPPTTRRKREDKSNECASQAVRSTVSATLTSDWSSSKSHACSMTSRSPFHSPGCRRHMPLSLRR